MIGALRHVAFSPPLAAVVLACGVCLCAYIYASKAGGGSDSYGYLSEAELILGGTLTVDQPWVHDLPWPKSRDTFTPLGYWPGAYENAQKIFPIYPAGFPLLLAAAKKIGGDAAKFWVVPCFAGVLVLATFGIGRRVASDTAGLIGAWLVATSPIVLLSSVVTMSDIPAAGAWAVAYYLVLGESGRSAFGAGLAAGLAITIRPNLVFLAPVLGLRYLIQAFSHADRRRALRQGALFSLGTLPGVMCLGAINNAVYGSPLTTGYGTLDGFFAAQHIGPNVANYFSWLIETQSPFALVGLAALVLPLRALWPAARRHVLVVSAVFVVVVWAFYFVYTVFDNWEFLRFLLPSWPLIMLGTGAVAAWAMRRGSRAVRALAVVAVVILGAYHLRQAHGHGTFLHWSYERRFIAAARMAARLTVPNSVILTSLHSGSVRYYGGRMTMRYDQIDREYIDVVVGWLKAHGVHVYLLVEDNELADIDQRWDETRTMDAIETSALAEFRGPGLISLFDLSEPRTFGDPTEQVTDVDSGLFVPGPVAPPTLVIRR